jgi:ribose transport system permease protein
MLNRSQGEEMKQQPMPVRSKPVTSRWQRSYKIVSPRKIGAVYVWAISILVFSLLSPSEFFTLQTLQAVANQYAVTGLAAMSLLVALASGTFDLSIGANIGLTGMVFALLTANVSIPIAVAVLVCLAVAVAIAAVNIVVIVVARIDSFIGTLATGAILSATTIAISGDRYVTARTGLAWSRFATHEWLGLSLSFYYLLIIAILIGYWLERTISGRYIYAIGFEAETARLTGIPVGKLRAAGLLTSGVLAGFAGVLLTAQIGSATPDAGTSYLIPAFSAAFLGATQIRPGRFNPWGTFIAVFLLATGDFGIVIVGGPNWATSMFEGLVLLVAVGVAGARRNRLRKNVARHPTLSSSRDSPLADPASAPAGEAATTVVVPPQAQGGR